LDKQFGQEEVQPGHVRALFRGVSVCVCARCIAGSCHNLLQEHCIRTCCFFTLQLTGSCYFTVSVKRKTHFSWTVFPLVFVRTLGSSLICAWWESLAKVLQLKWMTFANT